VLYLMGFEIHHSSIDMFRGQKCYVKCVECKNLVVCVCGGHC